MSWQIISPKKRAENSPAALRLNNTGVGDDAAVAPASAQFNVGTGDFTIWGEFTIMAGSGRIISKATGTAGMIFGTGSSGALAFNMRPQVGTIHALTVPNAYTIGKKVLFAVSRTGANTKPEDFSCYIDGGLRQHTANFTEMPTASLDTTEAFGFGRSVSAAAVAAYFASGGFCARALTAEEHVDLANGIFPIDQTRGAWRFNQRSGAVVPELAGTGNDLTVQGLSAAEQSEGLLSAWVPRGGIQFFSPAQSLSVFTAAQALQVTHLYRWLATETAFSWRHTDAANTTKSSGSGNFAADGSFPLSLQMVETDRLEITYNTSGNASIEVHYT